MPRFVRHSRFAWLLDFTETATRVWGILTSIVLWGVGADLTVHDHNLGIYVLIVAFLVSVLEAAFFVNILLDVIIRDDKNVCLQCTQALIWIDLWKKSALYIVMAIFCFLKPSVLWLATIGGSMLIISSFMYLLLTYKVHVTMEKAISFDKESSYDRFDDFQEEELDDSLPEPSNTNIGDQNDILQV